MMKPKRFVSIQSKMIPFSISLIFVVLLSFGTIIYQKTKDIVKDKVSISNINTITQIGSNFDIITQDIHDFSLFLIQNEDVCRYLKLSESANPNEVYRLQSNLQDALLNLISSKIYIDNIYIQGFNQMYISMTPKGTPVKNERIPMLVALKGKDEWFFINCPATTGSPGNTFPWSTPSTISTTPPICSAFSKSK
ncbi:hypothetical protein [Paenibacillus azoreducens]|uniref:Uncharacterized protein n=1 Tax=Paenibacillus azoreducens TaxID=116718 RepID=A0A919YHS5_9BACL|nr:hypothetical protein [Paenibacillus azoreducens]GIO51452.1 hypothetical protein J34TS1_62170 [Paenibacillus azoreducens]